MMEERHHATTQNRFYPDMSHVNKNITVETKLISPPTYNLQVKFSLFVCSFVCLFYIQVIHIRFKNLLNIEIVFFFSFV